MTDEELELHPLPLPKGGPYPTDGELLSRAYNELVEVTAKRDELLTLAARVVAHLPYGTMLGRDSERAYFDAKALRDALDAIDPGIVRRNMLEPGQPRPHWPDDKGCPRD